MKAFLLGQVFSVSNYSSALIFPQNWEERIIYQFQSTKYWCEPQVSKIVGVPKHWKITVKFLLLLSIYMFLFISYMVNVWYGSSTSIEASRCVFTNLVLSPGV